MAVADLIVRQGDTTPAVTATILDQNGAALNLTGATVQFVMRSMIYGTASVNAAATVTNATAGAVQYSWAAADTAVAGLYQAAFRVTLSGGATYTYPNDGYLDIWVEENLTSDTSQYLVSLADIKDHLNIPADGRTHDQKLLRWVMAARPVIESVTTVAVPRIFDEWPDGGNYFIHLRHRPATLLIACSIYQGPVEYPLSVVADPLHGSIYSAMLDPSGDRIVRRGPGGGVIPFPKMPNSVHVVYQAGPATVPENIRMGTLMMLQEHWNPTQQPGPRGGPGYGNPDDQAPTHDTPEFLVSPRVREWLIPSRRHPSVF